MFGTAFTRAHLAAAGLFLGGLVTSLQGLHSWSEAISIPFLTGVLAQVAALLTAAASKQVGRNAKRRERKSDHPPR